MPATLSEENSEEARRPYAAFISYRHADNQQSGRQWATWLHQQIENYEVPADLIGTVNERGEKIPERIFPVFQDEEELPADADLGSPIYRALDRSRFMVVICSPRSVASTYVNNEIAYFKRIGRSDRVLAAMIEGEPNASWDKGKHAAGVSAELECFPAALRHPVDEQGDVVESRRAEPVAADFRLKDGNQGWTSPEAYRHALREQGGPGAREMDVAAYKKQCELAKLKIIAGVLGVSLGTLTQRDKAYQLALAQKRTRALRRWLVALVALAALAIAGGLFGFWNAHVAETQRQQAFAARERTEATLASSYLFQAEDLIKAGRSADALPYLARSLRIRRQNNPAATVAFGCLSMMPVARMVFQHQDEIASATFSPDGTRVGTSSDDDSARVWNALTGDPVTPPLRHHGVVEGISFSPDGSRVLTQSNDGTARVWDAATGRPIAPPIVCGSFGQVTASFSPDGGRVLTAFNNVARVWDAQTGQPVSSPLEHKAYISSACFSPDGSRVLTASADGTACLWDATTGALLAPPLQHGGQVVWAAFSPDGKELATSSSDRATRVWDAATGRPLTPALQDSASSQAIAFSPDGRLLLIAAGNAAYLFDPKDNKLAVPALQHRAAVNSAAFSSDGNQVVTVAKDDTARVWTVATGQPAGSPIPLPRDTIPATALPGLSGSVPVTISNSPRLPKLAAFSPNGSAVVAICENSAQVWNAQTGRPMSLPLRHQGSVLSAGFSPDGAEVLTASRDFTARLWSSHAGRLISLAFPEPFDSSCASFSADGARVFAASWDNTQAVWGAWDVRSGRPLFPPLHHNGAITSAVFSPDGALVLTSSANASAPDPNTGLTRFSDFSAQVWNARTGEPVGPPLAYGGELSSMTLNPDGTRAAKADGEIASFCFNPDGTRLAIAFWFDHIVAVLNTATGRPLFPPLAAQNFVDFSPDGTRLVTTSTEHNARIWDAATGRPLTPPLAHGARVGMASFSADGTRVATASEDRTARVWDARTGQPVTPPLQHVASVLAAAFSPDGRHLATASGKFVYIWDIDTARLVCPALPAQNYVDSLVFSPDGARLATCSNTDLRLWETDTGQAIFPPLPRPSSLSFSPDGTRLMTLSEEGINFWDMSPLTTSPEWLPDVLEAAALQFLNDVDSLQQLPADKFCRIRQQRLASTSRDPWTVFDRWLFSDPDSRTLTPWAAETVRDYVRRLAADGSARSIAHAAALSTDHPDWLQPPARQ